MVEFARKSGTAGMQIVGIQSVDLVGMKAQGFSRQSSTIIVDLRVHAGAVQVIPSVGDQWIVRPFARGWMLDSKLPYDMADTTSQTVADNLVEGLTQVGSTNAKNPGPLHLNGSLIVANAPVKIPSYATADRPAAATVGEGAHIFDTTLGKPVWSTGAHYVDATGATV